MVVSSANAKPTHHRNATRASAELLKRIQAGDKEIMLQTGYGEDALVLWTDHGGFTELGASMAHHLAPRHFDWSFPTGYLWKYGIKRNLK